MYSPLRAPKQTSRFRGDMERDMIGSSTLMVSLSKNVSFSTESVMQGMIAASSQDGNVGRSATVAWYHLSLGSTQPL
jgi:hypothetical protein